MSFIFKNADIIINIIGLRCPDSLMKTRKTIRQMNQGETLIIITDDYTTIKDIPKFCLYMKHTLLAESTINIPYHYLLRKGLNKN